MTSETATLVNLKEKVTNLQNELKAPKNQHNSFGGYNYRSAEDILEAVKPLCLKYRVMLNVSDDVLAVGDRIYVKATATLADMDSADAVTSTAMAREEETKKGMDAAQITGSASSYARKYALNGLLAIDDTKDADATNTHGKSPKAAPKADPDAYKKGCWKRFKDLHADLNADDLAKGFDEYVTAVVGKGARDCDEADFKKAWSALNKKD